MRRMLHSHERKTSVTTVFYNHNLSIVFVLTNGRQPSKSCSLRRHWGLILHTGDTSVTVLAQVVNHYTYPQVNLTIKVANMRCVGRALVTGPIAASVQEVTLLSANF